MKRARRAVGLLKIEARDYIGPMSRPPSILKSRKPRIRNDAITAAERKFCKELLLHDDPVRAVTVAFPDRAKDADGAKKHWATTLKSRSRVKRELEALRAIATQDAGFEVADALGEFLGIWRADPNDLGSVRVGCCRYCWGEGGAYQWGAREYTEALRAAENEQRTMRLRLRPPTEDQIQELAPLPDCSGGLDFDMRREPNLECRECGGEGHPRVVAKDTMLLSEGGKRLFAGIKLTKYGPEVQMHNRMDALVQATRILGGFEDKVRVRATLDATMDQFNYDMTDPRQAAEAYKRLLKAGE